MKKLTDLEYLRLNTFQRLWYNIVLFVLGIPGWLASLVKAVGNGIAGAFRGIRNELTDCATTFTRGSWKTKVSYLVMGFGNIARGQVLRGLLFLVFESVFIVYMVTTGSYWLGKFRTLGDVPPGEVYNEVLDTYVYKIGLGRGQYAFSVAVGMFKSVVSVVLLFAVNKLSKRARGESII